AAGPHPARTLLTDSVPTGCGPAAVGGLPGGTPTPARSRPSGFRQVRQGSVKDASRIPAAAFGRPGRT
ncbi:hypothetical protein, partial [Streptomyces hirsutus]|uniref:hypothetical protein n=1 Tax=Streptomyces hirsutus TaxID=35620 RepID=UPI001B80621E